MTDEEKHYCHMPEFTEADFKGVVAARWTCKCGAIWLAVRRQRDRAECIWSSHLIGKGLLADAGPLDVVGAVAAMRHEDIVAGRHLMKDCDG